MDDRSFPILSVADLAAARDFYARLGFVQRYAFPADGEPAYVTMERDHAGIGLAAATTETTDRFAYWVYVDDVDATFTALVAAGHVAVGEPVDEPWGERVARVRDPDGNLVHLGAAR